MSITILVKSLYVRLPKHIQSQSQVSRGVPYWQRKLKNGMGVDKRQIKTLNYLNTGKIQ